ncbi:response regulator transcription factor [Chengkuizengella marina]|uniref:Response regulator n=1 Tax=Chengkuizengella marina TaxID=2507566 RepID=A0A6N9Q2S7_9BACL|nr:response regulator [Chengkuizengella marina]NBI29095.1 response regulator [Chengkuizengella marina]
MNKILIVDDEAIERMALQKILEKHIADIQIVGQASNGKEAIEMAKQFEPDLIFMDIRMPEVDGLAAVQKIKQFAPFVRFIMVSAYDTFEYARTALKLQVKDYILKPSKPVDIVHAVQKVLDEMDIEKKEKEAQSRSEERLEKALPIVEADLVTQLLFEHMNVMQLDEMIELLGMVEIQNAYVLLLVVQSKNFEKMESIALLELYREVKSFYHQEEQGFVGTMSGKHIPIIVIPDPEKTYRSHASSLIRKLINFSNRFQGIHFFIGVGKPCGQIEHIQNSYHEALLASADLDLPSKHFFYEDLKNSNATPKTLDLDLEKRMLEETRKGNIHHLPQLINQLIMNYASNKKPQIEIQQRVLQVLWLMSRSMNEMGFEVESPIYLTKIESIQQLKTETSVILKKMTEPLEKMSVRVAPDLLSRMKNYVYENANREISLEMLAEFVGLSPYYVSKLFKDQLGTNYIDFLTQCRLERARELMKDPQRSLKEITYEIGYKDPNYFSRVFKKKYGVSPTEYRKKF